MGYIDSTFVVTNAVQIILDASLYHFGILTSNVHMAWMRAVCGRLEMRYCYSKDIVYNNFPWPSPTDAQKAAIERTAQAILDDRDLASKTIESGDFAGMRLDEAIDRLYTADVFMHTWDLAKAADIEVHLSGSYAAGVHEGLAAMGEGLRDSGHFGPAVDTDSEDQVERLMAFVGRDPQWSAPSLASATS